VKGWFGTRKPEVSVVVVVHNMDREAPRTLYSLSAAYQQNIAADEYEVIVVDNGSTPPLDPKIIDGLSGNFRLIRLDPAPPSPAHAINCGLAKARGNVIGVMIDGARMVTPGLLHFAKVGAQLYPYPVVTTLGWYLGFDHQRWSVDAGYDEAQEDALLASVDWPKDGYRLFEIASLDGSSIDGYFAPVAESTAMFLPRKMWDALAGVDERFDVPGGGFLNLDTFRRAAELPESKPVILLGEGAFHQVHNGIASNSEYESFAKSIANWRDQYTSIRGHPWGPPNVKTPTYLGVLPRYALAHLVRSAVEPAAGGEPALGLAFDRALWLPAPLPRPSNPTIAALVDLAEAEFRARHFEAAAAVARMARSRAPDELAPQRLLVHAGLWLRSKVPAGNRRAGFHLARAKAHRLLNEPAAAAAEFHAALTYDEYLTEAHIGLAELRMPGDGYLKWLERLHNALRPETYLEIGVAKGQSIACARPPTRAIGIDPEPKINVALKAETHIFCETSDAFFARQGFVPLLNGKPLALGFIDGLHLFQQSLKDFMNVEAVCGPRSVILVHDTVPLNEVTQRPDRQRTFYTGDIWKTVLCLKHYRPDLSILTVATPWSGLTIITGLNPRSRVLAENYDAAIARFCGMTYAEIENNLDAALNLVPNDWRKVETQLKALGILGTVESDVQILDTHPMVGK
jgi:hypothetical protein